MDAGRKIKEYTSKLSKAKELAAKKRILMHYLPELADSLAKILERDPKVVESILSQALEDRYRKLKELEG